MHSTDWPRCPNCGDYALDGQATCGRSWCDEVCGREQRGESGVERIHVSGRRKPLWVAPEEVDRTSTEGYVEGRVNLSQQL